MPQDRCEQSRHGNPPVTEQFDELRRKRGLLIVGDNAQAGEGDMVFLTQSRGGGTLHVHGNRVVLLSESLFLKGVAHQFGHRQHAAKGDLLVFQDKRMKRRPTMALFIDHLRRQHEIANALLWR